MGTIAKNVRLGAVEFFQNANAPMGVTLMVFIANDVRGTQRDRMEIVHAMKMEFMMKRATLAKCAPTTGNFHAYLTLECHAMTQKK